MKFLWVFLVASLLSLASCKKKKEELIFPAQINTVSPYPSYVNPLYYSKQVYGPYKSIYQYGYPYMVNPWKSWYAWKTALWKPLFVAPQMPSESIIYPYIGQQYKPYLYEQKPYVYGQKAPYVYEQEEPSFYEEKPYLSEQKPLINEGKPYSYEEVQEQKPFDYEKPNVQQYKSFVDIPQYQEPYDSFNEKLQQPVSYGYDEKSFDDSKYRTHFTYEP